MTTQTTELTLKDRRLIERLISELDSFYNSVTQPVRSHFIAELQSARNNLVAKLNEGKNADQKLYN